MNHETDLMLKILTFLGVSRIVVGVQRAFVTDLTGDDGNPLLERALLLGVVLAELGRLVLDCDVGNLLVNEVLAGFDVLYDALEFFNDC